MPVVTSLYLGGGDGLLRALADLAPGRRYHRVALDALPAGIPVTTEIDGIHNPDLRTIETFDGKERVKEFYAISAEDAYSLLESIAKISGTLDRLQRLTPEGHEVLDEQIATDLRERLEASLR